MRYEKIDAFVVYVTKLPDADGGEWSVALHKRGEGATTGEYLVDGKGKTPSKAVRAAFREIGL